MKREDVNLCLPASHNAQRFWLREALSCLDCGQQSISIEQGGSLAAHPLLVPGIAHLARRLPLLVLVLAFRAGVAVPVGAVFAGVTLVTVLCGGRRP